MGAFPVEAVGYHSLCTVEFLVTPDLKDLGKRYPAFWSLPGERWFDCSLAAYLLSPEDRGYGWEQVVQRFGEQVER